MVISRTDTSIFDDPLIRIIGYGYTNYRIHELTNKERR